MILDVLNKSKNMHLRVNPSNTDDAKNIINQLQDNILIATLEHLYLQSLSVDKVADKMHCSTRTVYNRKNKAIKILEDMQNGT